MTFCVGNPFSKSTCTKVGYAYTSGRTSPAIGVDAMWVRLSLRFPSSGSRERATTHVECDGGARDRAIGSGQYLHADGGRRPHLNRRRGGNTSGLGTIFR